MNLQTNRILLRPWRESDAETLFKFASDPEVGPRAGWPPHKSVEESLNIIRTVFSADTMWAVEWKETGEAIGCVGYLPASASNLKIADDQCEVGYWIARPYWGKGICTEALQLVVDYCFLAKGFSVLWGDYFPENPASGRVMEKCGFVDTGDEVLCPNLEVGADRPVKVMKLEKDDNKLFELSPDEQAYWEASIKRDLKDRAEGKPQEYLSSEEFWRKFKETVKHHYEGTHDVKQKMEKK